MQAKLSENSTKKKENNTAALNWVSVEKKKDAYKLVDLPAQLIGVFFFEGKKKLWTQSMQKKKDATSQSEKTFPLTFTIERVSRFKRSDDRKNL